MSVPAGEGFGFTGHTLGKRWLVGGRLGSGSFGVVHAGTDLHTGEAVAIKLLHPQFIHQGEVMARFWNEAEALRRMNHPNVLTLMAVAVSEQGVPFLVTELLQGETFRELFDREGALPADRALKLLGPAAHALHHAHAVGVLHRDLKPENIFRARKDGTGTTKILDFGVAKLLDTESGRKLSQTGVLIGTMAYSPPEQLQGLADIDHRADQFGFAALLFEALTARRPFPQTNPVELFMAVLSGARPSATAIVPSLPFAADQALQRALEPDRNKRFASIEEFFAVLSYALMPSAAMLDLAPKTMEAARPLPLAKPTPAPQAAYEPVHAEPTSELARYVPPPDAGPDLKTTLTEGSMPLRTPMPPAFVHAPPRPVSDGPEPPSRLMRTLESGVEPRHAHRIRKTDSQRILKWAIVALAAAVLLVAILLTWLWLR